MTEQRGEILTLSIHPESDTQVRTITYIMSFSPYTNPEKMISIPVLQTKKVESQRGCVTCPKTLPKVFPR